MASTINTPHLDKSTSQSVRDSDKTRNDDQMSDDDVISSTSKFYHDQLRFLLTHNDSTLAQQSLKQIAKILQSISKKPGDKKVRQHPMQGIIIKKFVSGVQGGIDLMSTLGFEETNIDGKPYLQLADDHQTITDADDIADDLIEAATHPETITGTDGKTMSSTGTGTGTGASSLSSAAAGASTEARKCLADCGFWGSPTTNWYCSTCYRKLGLVSSLLPPPSFTTPKPIKTKSPKNVANEKLYIEVCDIARAHRRGNTRQDKWARAKSKLRTLYYINKCCRPIQHDRERCWSCNRKLGLSGTECRCGYVFCGRHRYAQEHACTFDHYKRHQQTLSKYNTAIGRSKLDDQESEYD